MANSVPVISLKNGDVRYQEKIEKEKNDVRVIENDFEESSDLESSDIFDSDHNYPIDLHSFTLPGLGDSGPKCGINRITDFSTDGRSVKYSPLSCGRIQCPNCYMDWSRDVVFSMAMKIETVSKLRDGERPNALVMSVPPAEIKDWTWDKINTSLFRRGYRRVAGLETVRCDIYNHTVDDCPNCHTEKVRCDDVGSRGHHVDDCPNCHTEKVRCELHEKKKTHHVDDCPNCHTANTGVDGGYAIFHPFRIKKIWQKRFKRSGEAENSGGMWKAIRQRVRDGASLYEFVKLGPHVHSIVFGEPEPHEGEDYFIGFDDDDHNLPKDLDDVSDVVALLNYLITHTGILNHLKKYEGGEEPRIQRQQTHTVRSFGSMFHVQPQKVLEIDEFNELAKKVAEANILRKNDDGEPIGMEWDDEKAEKLICEGASFSKLVDECLLYPASSKELDTSEPEPEWVPINDEDLFVEYFNKWIKDPEFPAELRDFWIEVYEFIVREHRAPNFSNIPPPPDMDVWGEFEDYELVSDGSQSDQYNLEGGEVPVAQLSE